MLSDLDPSDTGHYTCVAVNPVSGHNRSATHVTSLTVTPRSQGPSRLVWAGACLVFVWSLSVWFCLVWSLSVWFCLVWSGLCLLLSCVAWSLSVWFCPVWSLPVWFCLVWSGHLSGVVLFGLVFACIVLCLFYIVRPLCGLVLSGLVWSCLVWSGLFFVWFRLVWTCLVFSGLVFVWLCLLWSRLSPPKKMTAYTRHRRV